MKKQFLYLVQSRLDRLEYHKVLESENSDYIVGTFEKKIDLPNAIYIPNTVWEQGRNALYEEALRISGDYEYFIFLDDDVLFKKGSFREFEKEVLEGKPDFCIPLYYSNILIRRYYKIFGHYFKYSKLIYADSMFICISKTLFYDKRLLPYSIDYKNIVGIPDYNSSKFFWMNLYEYFYATSSIHTINAVIVKNANNLTSYNSDSKTFKKMREAVRQKTNKYKNIQAKQMPSLYIYDMMRKNKIYARLFWYFGSTIFLVYHLYKDLTYNKRLNNKRNIRRK